VNEETEHRIQRVLGAITDAKMAVLATGESFEVGSEGRAPVKSDRFKEARKQVFKAEQARNRLFVELLGGSTVVPVELSRQFGLTGREAVHIAETALTGSVLMRDNLFGQQDPLAVNLDD
jgi:hypothetical protein